MRERTQKQIAPQTELEGDDPESMAGLVKHGDALRARGQSRDAEQAYRQALARADRAAACPDYQSKPALAEFAARVKLALAAVSTH